MKPNAPKTHPLKRVIKSFHYALRGIWELFLYTPNARIHLLCAIAVVILAAILGVSKVEWLILVLTIFLVFSMEAMNSALEKLADRVSPEYSPLIRDAKDLAAGAVLLVAIGAVIVGLIIFSPYLF